MNKLAIVTIDIRYENDVVLVRQKARVIAGVLRFDKQDQTRIATAVSEIARNAYQYGGGGKAEFAIDQTKRMLLISIRDSGQGIKNLNQILDGNYVSRTGMGKGLAGANRLMDLLKIETGNGSGTTVLLGKQLPHGFHTLTELDLRNLYAALAASTDNVYEELREQNKEVLRSLEELKEKQSQLTQLNRELDETNRGVVALYAELNDKAEFLQRASEMKSNFLSNMSHEFRTPLNSILALSQILLDRLDGQLTTEQEKQVRFIRSAANSLVELVSDLLDIAKVEAGKVTIRPAHFTVDSLFAALRGMLRPLLAQNSSVVLTFDEPDNLGPLFTDEAKISQILRNFISNALKFTERGEIRVSAQPGRGKSVIFSVSDTGIGIAKEDQEKIFLEWTQIEGRLQKAAKGSGLGLPLSRRLAQLLGGNVFVKSELGVGSTFFAQVPISFGGPAEILYIPETPTELDEKKLPVLVVEDNRETLFLYEKYLKASRYQPIPARNLKEARLALQSVRPSAIILDVLLEAEQSWDLLRELRSNPQTSSLPIFVVTVVENKTKALAMGATGFHTKPIDRIWLLDQLQAHTQEKSKPQVLIVDDDAASRYVVKTILGDSNFRFIEAASGGEGIRVAAEAKPELIILDLVMPDLTGFQVLDQLKNNPDTAPIPVVVHTSRDLDENDRENLGSAAGIVIKTGQSREVMRASFTEAFIEAGLHFAEFRRSDLEESERSQKGRD